MVAQEAPSNGACFDAAFESIHPAVGGHARCERALTNCLVRLNDHPPLIVLDGDVLAYYDAIDAFDTEADLDSIIEFLKFETVKTWAKPMGLAAPRSSRLLFGDVVLRVKRPLSFFVVDQKPL